MTQSVIVNGDGEYYAGFDGKTGKPVWFKAQRKDCKLDDYLADMVLSQLTALGFQGITKEAASAD